MTASAWKEDRFYERRKSYLFAGYHETSLRLIPQGMMRSLDLLNEVIWGSIIDASELEWGHHSRDAPVLIQSYYASMGYRSLTCNQGIVAIVRNGICQG
jgi:hypothetical protein